MSTNKSQQKTPKGAQAAKAPAPHHPKPKGLLREKNVLAYTLTLAEANVTRLREALTSYYSSEAKKKSDFIYNFLTNFSVLVYDEDDISSYATESETLNVLGSKDWKSSREKKDAQLRAQRMGPPVQATARANPANPVGVQTRSGGASGAEPSEFEKAYKTEQIKLAFSKLAKSNATTRAINLDNANEYVGLSMVLLNSVEDSI